MNNNFDELIKMTRENGPEYFSVFGRESSDMAGIYNDIIMVAKEALNLGVLQKIDEEAIRRLIPDPTSSSELTSFNTESLINSIEKAKNRLNYEAETQLKGRGIEKGAKSTVQPITGTTTNIDYNLAFE